MPDRMTMIGEIRTCVDALYEADRGALVKEILGGVHPHDFTGVSDDAVRQMHREIVHARQLVILGKFENG